MRLLFTLALVFTLAFTGLAACGKQADPGPPCDRVVDHMLEVMKQGMTGHDTVQLGNRKLMIEQCEQRKLPAAERSCLLATKDLAGIAACRKPGAPGAPPAPTRPLPTGSAAPAPAPASGSGG